MPDEDKPAEPQPPTPPVPGPAELDKLLDDVIYKPGQRPGKGDSDNQ